MCILTHMKPDEAARYDHIAANCALFATRRLSRSVTRLYDAALAPIGLRGTQYNVLVAIARGRGESMTELGAALGTDRTTLTHALRALTRDRLVQAVRGADARARALRLTPLGLRRVAAAVPHWERAQAMVEQALGGGRWRALHGELRKLNKAIQAIRSAADAISAADFSPSPK
jgi:DNA-binding MarR family transcriptional regulator